MTESPPDPASQDEWAEKLAQAVGGESELHFGTVKVLVPSDCWVEALTTARDQFGLTFFSWLSVIDWTQQVAVGEPPADTTERLEVIAALGGINSEPNPAVSEEDGEPTKNSSAAGRFALFSTDLSHQQPTLATLVEVFPGANWHEREAAEMFGVDFSGHPDLSPLYLPDAFEGNPLRKTFPLLSREVKPWPGLVDVEPMPEPDSDSSSPTDATVSVTNSNPSTP